MSVWERRLAREIVRQNGGSVGAAHADALAVRTDIVRMSVQQPVFYACLLMLALQGPEHNVYAQLPPEYPFLETKLPASMAHYKSWANSG